MKNVLNADFFEKIGVLLYFFVPLHSDKQKKVLLPI